MTIDEAAKRLREAYAKAGQGDRALTIHLFGIRHAGTLSGMPLKEILIRAEMPVSYHVEIRKGMRIAEHVELKSKDQ